MRRLVGWALVLFVVAGGIAWAVTHFNSADPDKVAAEVAALNAPGYCSQLATTPKGLVTAVSNAAAGNATDDDKKTIRNAVTQLRKAVSADGVPADLKKKVEGAVALLDKLANGEGLTLSEATSLAKSLQNMGEAVKKACSAK